MELNMNDKLSLKDLSVENKKVLMRVDFNVPIDAQGNITDDSRIVASLPSIQYVLDHGGSLILMSHLGRPKSDKDLSASLEPCAKRLSELLNIPVKFLPHSIGSDVSAACRVLKPGEVILLQNLRFHKAEEDPASDPTFAKQLAALGDVYVNDAFGTAHRMHSSTATITQYFPFKAAAGFLMEKELHFIGDLLTNPKRPFIAIIGGSKISTKIGVLKALLKKADKILIGGAMSYTFLKAQGVPIGNSMHEEGYVDLAKELLTLGGDKLVLPIDHIVTQKVEAGSPYEVQTTIANSYIGVDIGPKTIQRYLTEITNAQTALWNGPMGVFEIPEFSHGTLAIATALANSKAVTVAGGGDTLAAIHQSNVANQFTHLSTGGGATLEFIELGSLPGIEALSNKIKAFSIPKNT